MDKVGRSRTRLGIHRFSVSRGSGGGSGSGTWLVFPCQPADRRAIPYSMEAMPSSVRLGLLVLGFGGAWLLSACRSNEPSEAGSLGPGADPPGPLAEAPLAIKNKFPGGQNDRGLKAHVPPPEPLDCSGVAKVTPCMRYYLPLLGNPSTDLPLQKSYKNAFGDACYNSADATPTFNCFYRKKDVEGTAAKEGQACTDAKMIADIVQAAPYDKQYKCLQTPGTENYWLQVGPDPAIHIDINYGIAPLETSLIDVGGVPTAINGPYRNLPEPSTVEPGRRFWCDRINGVAAPRTPTS